MFIQTAEPENPNVLKFLPGREVNEGEKIVFESAENIAPSSLAARIFHVPEVLNIELDTEYVLVTKSENIDWVQLKPPILGAIMDYFLSGDSVNSNVDEIFVEENQAQGVVSNGKTVKSDYVVSNMDIFLRMKGY